MIGMHKVKIRSLSFKLTFVSNLKKKEEEEEEEEKD